LLIKGLANITLVEVDWENDKKISTLQNRENKLPRTHYIVQQMPLEWFVI